MSKCNLDFACPLGYSCVDGECLYREEDCNKGYYDGKCNEILPYYAECTADEQCPEFCWSSCQVLVPYLMILLTLFFAIVWRRSLRRRFVVLGVVPPFPGSQPS